VAAIPIHYKGEAIGDLNMASHTHEEISTSTRHVLESVSVQIGETIVRARMEEKLRESEEQFRNLYQSIQDPIGIYVGREGHLINYNKAFKRMTEYTNEELKDKIFLDFVHPDDQAMVLERYRTKYPEEELPLVYEIRAVNKKGETIPIEISVSTYKVKDRVVGIEVIHRDITERKRMEDEIVRYSEHLEELVEERTRELKEAQEQLVKSERLAAIGEASTMVGHDLRNPLQAIENATYYLNNELPRLPVSQKITEMLQVINESVNYADKIVRDLHDFASTKEPILRKTNVNAIVEETLSQVEAPENVELIMELGPLPEIKVDKDLIKRAFLNLAVNGIQAMEKRGKLKVSTKKTKGFVEISFKDTGIGISKENMKKLFTPFFTTKAKGMGIGLSICKRFIDSHGGSIEVKSEEGKGSTFTVKLPIQQNNGGENQ
jgi:PAS domain S-box-containing protein